MENFIEEEEEEEGTWFQCESKNRHQTNMFL